MTRTRLATSSASPHLAMSKPGWKSGQGSRRVKQGGGAIQPRAKTRSILAEESREKRDELLGLLERAYWMEIETVMSYIASSTNPDGVRAQEIAEALADDVLEELGHAREFAQRIKELYGVVPGSLAFEPEQSSLQPPTTRPTSCTSSAGSSRRRRARSSTTAASSSFCDGVDYVTQDMTIDMLHDEERHRRLFEGFLREFERARMKFGR